MFETSPVDFRSLLSNMCLSVVWIKWYECAGKQKKWFEWHTMTWLLLYLFCVVAIRCCCQLFDWLSGLMNEWQALRSFHQDRMTPSCEATPSCTIIKGRIIKEGYSMSLNCKNVFFFFNFLLRLNEWKPCETDWKAWKQCNGIHHVTWSFFIVSH